MDRRSADLLIALALAAYGIWYALYVPAMLAGTPQPFLLIAFLAIAVLALVAAFGVARRQPWAAIALVLLGVTVAVTQLIEGFVLGILPWLRAVLVAVLALVTTVALASYYRARG
jgi:hypothetical protein